MSDIQIGERQTVDRAKHPTLGEGRLVYDNGPCFFIADTGETERFRQWGGCGSRGKTSYVTVIRPNGSGVDLDTTNRESGKKHQRVVSLEGNRPGWMSSWFDEFHTYCHVFEPDDGGAPLKFAVHQLWVGGEKDNGNPPKSREHLMTVKGPRCVFVYYREQDAEKAKAAESMPVTKPRTKKTQPKGPPPGPDATRAEIDAWMRSA